MRTLPLALALASIACPAAHAEKADREKPIAIVADHFTADDAQKSSDFLGNVVVTQGTMRITADKVHVKEDAAGLKSYVANGGPLTFRQKRDSVDEYIDGEALRAEFDEKTDVLRLYQKGRVKSGANEIAGDFISYDMTRELAEVAGAPPGTKAPANSRVKMIILPPRKPGKDAAKGEPAADPDKGPSVTLKPDPGKP